MPCSLYAWLPLELAHLCSLMMSVLMAAAGWMLKYSYTFCLLRSKQVHQNWLDDASSSSRTVIQNIAIISKEIFWSKKWNLLDKPITWPQSNRASHLLKTRTEGKYPLKQAANSTWAAVQVWQSIIREETKHLVISKGPELQAVIDYKRFSTKYWIWWIFISVNFSNYFWSPKIGGTTQSVSIWTLAHFLLFSLCTQQINSCNKTVTVWLKCKHSASNWGF